MMDTVGQPQCTPGASGDGNSPIHPSVLSQAKDKGRFSYLCNCGKLEPLSRNLHNAGT